jgi:hypothetical protein
MHSHQTLNVVIIGELFKYQLNLRKWLIKKVLYRDITLYMHVKS